MFSGHHWAPADSQKREFLCREQFPYMLAFP
jgi:hypothetical protein